MSAPSPSLYLARREHPTFSAKWYSASTSEGARCTCVRSCGGWCVASMWQGSAGTGRRTHCWNLFCARSQARQFFVLAKKLSLVL
eukprot:8920721-Pyramimonas_sp.AAC.1